MSSPQSNAATKDILTRLRDKARAESGRQATMADLQKHELVRQQIRARADAFADVAKWLESELGNV
jgi:hypothetical protein